MGNLVDLEALNARLGQASIRAINNRGDIGKVLKELGSAQTAKNLAIAMVSAGLTTGITGTETFKDLLPKGNDLAARLGQQAAYQAVNAGAGVITDTVIQGRSLDASLRDRLVSAAVGAGAAVTANEIGMAYASGSLDPVSHKIVHAALGCAVGAANGGSCGAGAVGATLAETTAEIMGKALSEGRELTTDERKSILAGSRVAAIIGAAVLGGNERSADAAATNAVTNNYLTAKQLAQLIKETDECNGEPSCIKDVNEKYSVAFIINDTMRKSLGEEKSQRMFAIQNDQGRLLSYLQETWPNQSSEWYKQTARELVSASQASYQEGPAAMAEAYQNKAEKLPGEIAEGIDVVQSLTSLNGLTDKVIKKIVSLGTKSKGVPVTIKEIATDAPPAKRHTGETVLVHYPEYVELSDSINARRYQIPNDVWEKMTDIQRWEANQKFLDRTIARGDSITLATPASAARPGSYYAREIDYMIKKGYTVSNDGIKLIPPGK